MPLLLRALLCDDEVEIWSSGYGLRDCYVAAQQELRPRGCAALCAGCSHNREPWLAHPKAHEALLAAWKEAGAWSIGFYVIMPDHIHFFCAPHDLEIPLKNWMRFWKSRFSKLKQDSEWRWQSGEWDTRLRRSENYRQKWEYVRHNPVRKELVDDPDEWPFQGELNVLIW